MIRRLTLRALVATLVVTVSGTVAVPAAAAAPAASIPAPEIPTPAPGVPAASVDGRITVRLVGLDGRTTTSVISSTSAAAWNGSTGYAALKAERIGTNRYRVSASNVRVCPGADSLTVPNGPLSWSPVARDAVRQLQAVLGALNHDPGPIDGIFGDMTQAAVESFQREQSLSATGSWSKVDADRARQLIAGLGVSTWTELGVANGPIRFTTGGSETNLAPADTLGVCRPDGQVTHYRGSIIAITDGAGTARTVNEVGVENYLRGVVPREVSASWGNAGNGAGMHALRAQAVAARSYALSQNRYSYAQTCDTTACQAYGGAARRTGAPASASSLEHPLTDQAIRETAGVVRVWPDGTIVSTEYSASNGPRTAGGAFPAVDDVPGDGVAANPNHHWTRVVSASSLLGRYGVGSPLRAAATPESSSMRNQGFEGIWARYVRIEGSSSTRTETAWNFRGSYGFPSPGFQFSRVEGRTTDATVAIIGDSVGASVLGSPTSPGPLRMLLDGAVASEWYHAQVSRRTGPVSNPNSGLHAAQQVPQGTDLVIVQLGYNDLARSDCGHGTILTRDVINSMVDQLGNRGVRSVAWVNLSTRNTCHRAAYEAVNANLAAVARERSQLTVLDWDTPSSGSEHNRWFTDGIHLTVTGRAEFSRFLNDEVRELLPAPSNGRIQAVLVDGVGFGHGRGMSQWGAYGWAVTQGRTWTEILDHYYGGTANGTVATGGDRNEGVTPTPNPTPNAGPSRPIDTPQKVRPSQPLRRLVAGVAGVPDDGSATAVALNVTVTEPDAWGYLTVWPCGSPMPVASNVNFLGRGATEPNAVLVQLDQTGEVCFYSSADAHVIVDVAGWFTDGFEGVVPARVVDTRSGVGAPAARVRPDEPLRVSFADRADQFGPPADSAVGVALNVTGVEPTAAGYMTVWPCGAERPTASNINYSGPSSVEPNLVLVDLDDTREVCIHSFAPAHVLVDVAGWFTSGFEGLVPTRVVDTRSGLGAPAARVRADQPLQVPLAGRAEVPDDGSAVAVALNVTAVDTSGVGFLTVWPCGAAMPEASNVNFTSAGAVEPNAVLVQLDETGTVCVHASAATHVIVDVGGWFSAGFEGIVPTRVVDTRRGFVR